MNKIKFCNVLGARTLPPHIATCLEEQPKRSGMYNWIFAFQGDIYCYDSVKDRLEDYDVLQVNMSPMDWSTVLNIRESLPKSSSTKLVINNDHVCEMWGQWEQNPYLYDHIQRQGDMVFGTEPHQVSNMIKGTFTIPHPTNTDSLKQWHKTLDYEEESSIGFIFHWWARQTHLPWKTVETVRKKYGIKRNAIFGYKPAHDESYKYQKLMWDEKYELMPFPDFAKAMIKQRVLYDPNPCHTYGRNGVEMACFKKPIVGSDRVYSYKKLFPELTCDPFDKKANMQKFKQVLTDKAGTEEILSRAYKEVEFFNYANSRKRFLEALEISADRGGNDYYRMG